MSTSRENQQPSKPAGNTTPADVSEPGWVPVPDRPSAPPVVSGGRGRGGHVQLGPLAVLAGEAATTAGAGLYTAAGLPGLLVAAGAGIGAAAFRMTRPDRRPGRTGSIAPGSTGTRPHRPARSSLALGMPPLASLTRSGGAGRTGRPASGRSGNGTTRAGSGRRVAGLGRLNLPRLGTGGGSHRGHLARPGRSGPGLRLPHAGPLTGPGTSSTAATRPAGPLSVRVRRAARRTARALGRTGRGAAGAIADARRALRAHPSGRGAVRAAWRGDPLRPWVRRRWVRRALAALLATGGAGTRSAWRWLHHRRPVQTAPVDDGGVADTVNNPQAPTPAGPADPTGTTPATPSAPVPHPDDQPPSAFRPAPVPGGPVSQFAPAAHLEDAVAAVAKYDPDTMFEFFGHLKQLPEMCENFAKIFTTLAVKTHDELPAAPTVVALLEEMSRVSRMVGQAAQEIEPGARRAHEHDLARQEAPRTNENKWNV
ncbi:hypothetical protein [Frankia sp. Cj5]|uniref:hypothetical protein n=1 Tax=Frankia sp. Cj5 TaxID=2880978 RepID=UPI001EF46748|nr:hypothetical protein [Frankia sp. Cj5]